MSKLFNSILQGFKGLYDRHLQPHRPGKDGCSAAGSGGKNAPDGR